MLMKSNPGVPRYMQDVGTKNMRAYNKFGYKKSKNDCKVEDRFYKKLKMINFQSHLCKIADKETAYNEG